MDYCQCYWYVVDTIIDVCTAEIVIDLMYYFLVALGPGSPGWTVAGMLTSGLFIFAAITRLDPDRVENFFCGLKCRLVSLVRFLIPWLLFRIVWRIGNILWCRFAFKYWNSRRFCNLGWILPYLSFFVGFVAVLLALNDGGVLENWINTVQCFVRQWVGCDFCEEPKPRPRKKAKRSCSSTKKAASKTKSKNKVEPKIRGFRVDVKMKQGGCKGAPCGGGAQRR